MKIKNGVRKTSEFLNVWLHASADDYNNMEGELHVTSSACTVCTLMINNNW